MSDRLSHLRPADRLRTELRALLIALLVGLLIVPVAIFIVGQLTLGPYREAAGLGTFLADYYVQLARGDGATWLMTTAPLMLWLALRGLGWIWRQRDREPPDDD